jgi:hypothetical protein
MDNATSNFYSLAARVEKLEKQNRFLKRAGLALLVLPAALIFMGQSRAPRAIEAEDFILRDAAGTKRAELSMGADAAGLLFFNSKGQTSSFLTDGMILLGDPQNTKVKPESGLRESGYVMLSMVDSAPRVQLRDSDGFSASLGVTDTVTVGTGQTHKSSAASLTLFGAGKPEKVLWSAP